MFAARKSRALREAFGDGQDHKDFSPKGSVDEPIKPLLDMINDQPQYFSTSSCSGRVSVFDRKRSKWMFVSHDFPVECPIELKNELNSIPDSEDEDVVLKFEPLILAIEASDLDSAVSFLRAAVDAGYRESGISTTCSSDSSSRIIVSVRCSIRIESPLVIRKKKNISDSCLEILFEDVNRKFSANLARAQDLFSNLSKLFKKGETEKLSASYILLVPKVNTKIVQDSMRNLDFSGTSSTCKISVFDRDKRFMQIPLNAKASKFLLENESLKFIDSKVPISSLFPQINFEFEVILILSDSNEEEKSLSTKELNVHERLRNAFLKTGLVEVDMLDQIPSKWEILGNDIVLFPENSFCDSRWGNVENVWKICSEVLSVSRVGRQERMDPTDPKRKSKAKIYFSSKSSLSDPSQIDGWVIHKENGVKYNFDVTKTMFASGNGTERKRLPELIQPGEIVADLFAGIGYFTLPALVISKLNHIYACEWNSYSVEALRRGLNTNKIDTSRITIIEGDNRILKLESLCDRIFLGLIPSSEYSWPMAIQLLKPEGGWMHIHANVHVDRLLEFQKEMLHKLYDLVKSQENKAKYSWNLTVRHVECVKSYAPKIDHLVFDIECMAQLNSELRTMQFLGNQILWRDTVPVVSYSEFNCKSRFPVVIRGMDLGACRDKWSLEYLKNSVGSKSISIHVCPEAHMDFNSKNFSYKVLKFDDFCDYLSGSKIDQHFISPNERYYLRSLGNDQRKDIAKFFKDYPSLAEDFRLPVEIFPKDRLFSSVLRISSPDCQLWTHYDVVDNLLCHIKGRKEVVLFPPTEVGNLYVETSSSNVINWNSPEELEMYPKFKNCKGISSILEEGDILFIPALWFHNVKSLKSENCRATISLNLFWKELDDRFYTLKDLYGNRDHKPGADALLQASIIIKSLEDSHIPTYYQQFYLHKIASKLVDRSL